MLSLLKFNSQPIDAVRVRNVSGRPDSSDAAHRCAGALVGSWPCCDRAASAEANADRIEEQRPGRAGGALRCAAVVAVVQTADLWNGDDPAER